MTFTVTVNGFCAAGRHADITVHVGERNFRVPMTKAEMLENRADVDDLVRQRIVSFVKENHAGDWPATKTALEAATFKV